MVEPGKEAVDNQIKGFLGNLVNQENRGCIFIISHDHGYYKLINLLSRGNGYIGRSMSMNTKRAYERGLKPLSRFTSADLKQHGFHYPVRFFRWLVYNWNIYLFHPITRGFFIP